MSIDESAESAAEPPRKPKKSRKTSTKFILRCVLAIAVVIGLGLIAYRGYRANQATNAAIAELTRLSNDRTLIDAVVAQNAQSYRLNRGDIAALDRRYQADATTTSGIAAELIARPASQMLRSYMDGAQDRIVLIMLMDKAGLNVAASRLTHDYWQGDEEKFTQTMPLGPGAVHWGKAERDDVTGRVMHIVARTMIDPKTGEPIGAIAVGYDRIALGR
jgi:hypothetical protein